MLAHQGIRYYWKVRVNDDEMERSLSVVIGLEEKSSSFFDLYYLFKDPFLHFPTSGRGPVLSPEEAKPLKALEKISPQLIVDAIDFANKEQWQNIRYFALAYIDGVFTVTTSDRMR